MPTTVFLVRWFGGWHEVTVPTVFDRSEALLSLGAQQSVEEVERLATMELSTTFAKNREQLTVEHRPATLTEAPYLAYVPSDGVTADDFDGTPTEYPVLSMNVSEDVDGVLRFVPVVGDIIVGVDALQEQLALTPPPLPAPKEWLRGQWQRPDM